jgi:hypothetical protein
MGGRLNVGLFDLAPSAAVGDLAHRKRLPSLYGRDQGRRWRDPTRVSGIADTRSASMASVRKCTPPAANVSPAKISQTSSPGSGPRRAVICGSPIWTPTERGVTIGGEPIAR